MFIVLFEEFNLIHFPANFAMTNVFANGFKALFKTFVDLTLKILVTLNYLRNMSDYL